jgi:2-methylisocitrate lyase-like PEP mutase family enzyme
MSLQNEQAITKGKSGGTAVSPHRIESPINILGGPTAAPLHVLREIGINRVSFGPFVFRSCLRKFVDIVEGLVADDDYTSLGNLMSRDEVSEYLPNEHE